MSTYASILTEDTPLRTRKLTDQLVVKLKTFKKDTFRNSEFKQRSGQFPRGRHKYLIFKQGSFYNTERS